MSPRAESSRVALLCRQLFSALPPSLFVRHLGIRRAVANDLSTYVVATVAIPAADLALRLNRFRALCLRFADVPSATGAGSLNFVALPAEGERQR